MRSTLPNPSFLVEKLVRLDEAVEGEGKEKIGGEGGLRFRI
jgi:hypothetical protein